MFWQWITFEDCPSSCSQMI
uniref:Uncharacterized protein n=1 Tax=Rhizophora mucronata TaxID=61149 RepID=A0A2P2L9W4_RHIMU